MARLVLGNQLFVTQSSVEKSLKWGMT